MLCDAADNWYPSQTTYVCTECIISRAITRFCFAHFSIFHAIKSAQRNGGCKLMPFYLQMQIRLLIVSNAQCYLSTCNWMGSFFHLQKSYIWKKKSLLFGILGTMIFLGNAFSGKISFNASEEKEWNNLQSTEPSWAYFLPSMYKNPP